MEVKPNVVEALADGLAALSDADAAAMADKLAVYSAVCHSTAPGCVLARAFLALSDALAADPPSPAACAKAVGELVGDAAMAASLVLDDAALDRTLSRHASRALLALAQIAFAGRAAQPHVENDGVPDAFRRAFGAE